MIEIKNVTKKFEDIAALTDMTFTISEGEVFGLVGTNGAGKSTLLRILSGVLLPDRGEVLIDGKAVYENPEVKQQICFLSDSWYTPVSASALDMADTFALYYPSFDRARFLEMLNKINLDPKRKLRTYSKGMKKQVHVLLGICTGTKYLFCDETFDGLDPVMRQNVKSLFATEMLDRDFTPVIASHNLRELEDICDNVGLLHRGGVLFAENLEEMKFHMQKVQCVIKNPEAEAKLLQELQVVRHEYSGSMLTFVAKGTRTEIMDAVNRTHPIFAEVLPLSLEEIFISETEVAGYDFKNIFA